MLWFSVERGRGGSGLPGLMDNADCGRPLETSGLALWKFPIENPCGIGPISVDNFLISHRTDKNDNILWKANRFP